MWSSKDDASLKKGAIMGAILSTTVLFLFGFAGFLATWAGYSNDSNTALFAILKAGQDTSPLWITLVVAIFAITMNESGKCFSYLISRLSD